jgi:hypothetical protein
MTSSIGLLGAFVDVAILLVLAAAVASPRMSRLARALIAIGALVGAWLLTGVFDALRAPGWTMVTGSGVIVASIIVTTVTVHLWTQGSDCGGAEPGTHGADGGGGPRRRRPDVPDPRGGGSSPSWWPEFERQVALYVAEREREKQRSAAFTRESPPHARR